MPEFDVDLYASANIRRTIRVTAENSEEAREIAEGKTIYEVDSTEWTVASLGFRKFWLEFFGQSETKVLIFQSYKPELRCRYYLYSLSSIQKIYHNTLICPEYSNVYFQ